MLHCGTRFQSSSDQFDVLMWFSDGSVMVSAQVGIGLEIRYDEPGEIQNSLKIGDTDKWNCMSKRCLLGTDK